MKKITASILSVLMMLSMVFSSSVFAANEQPSAWQSFVGMFNTQATTAVGVEYRGHIQDIGNYPINESQWIQGPNQLGTVGKSLRLEAFWIKLTNKPANVNIQYRVHVQNKGWMDPVANGKLAGTTGESLRIEAIEIKLVDDAGKAVTGYSVQYKGHVQNVGDVPKNDPKYTGTTGWYADGQQLGTVGASQRLEALEVQIVKIDANMTAYNAAVAQAGTAEEADYTTASFAALTKALADNVVTVANTQAEVDAATAAITTAYKALVPGADLTAYNAIVEKANAVEADLFTTASYADLTKALEDNVATKDSSAAEVTAATDAITAAFDALVLVAEMDAYDAAVLKANAVVEADYTAATYAALEKALADNVVTNQNTQTEVDDATSAITAAYDALELLAQVTGVQATTAKTLTVEFNKAIVAADQAKAVFAVKNGTTTVTTSPTWAEDGMSVDLTRSSNLQAGNYTVTVTGFDFKAGTNVGTTTVVAPKVSKIEFASANAIVVAATPTTATFNYVVYDQYGTDITKTTALTGTANNSVSVSFNASTKTATLTSSSSFLAVGAPTSVITTLINGATGTTATQTMTIVKEIQLSEFALGDITYPTGKDKLYESTVEAGKIGFTALDQFGNAVANPSASVTLVSSDPSTASFSWQKDAAGTSYIRVTTSAIATGTEKALTLTAVSTTGLTSSLPMTIYKASTATTIVLGDVSKTELAVGDTKVYLDVAVYDQFGTLMTPDKYISLVVNNPAAGLKMSYNNVASTNATLISNINDPNYGKLELNFTGMTAGSATIMSNLNASTPVTKTLTVNAVRALTEAVAPATNPTIMAGGTAKLGFTFNDQFGTVMTTIPDVATGSHEIKITNVSGDAGALTITSGHAAASANNAQSTLNDIYVSAAAGKAGVYTVEVIVYNKVAASRTSADIITSATTTVTIQQSGSTGMTYTVEALGRDLFSDTAAQTVDASNAYAAPIVVKATDANGNVMTVPASQITNVQGAGLVVGAPAATTSTTVPSQTGQWVIGTKSAANVAADGITFTSGKATTTAYVSVNTGTSVKTIALPVTLSNQAKLTAEIRIIDRDGFVAANTQKPYALVSTAIDVDTFQFADSTAAATGTPAYIYTKDQYGVWSPQATIAPDASQLTPLQSTWITTRGATSGIGFAAGVVKADLTGNLFGYKAGASIPYSLNFGGTVNKQFSVKIGTEFAPTVGVGVAGDATTVIPVFAATNVADRANLSLDGVVVAGTTLTTAQKEALLISNTLANGATPVAIADVSVVVHATDGTVTITLPNCSATTYTGALSLNLAKITDLFGNATSGATTLTINDSGTTWERALN